MKKIVLALSISMMVFQSCDRINDPIVPDPEFSSHCDSVYTFPGPTQTVRNVLLEKYTGHKCANCPWPSYLADSLKTNFYGNQLIAVAIHPLHPLAEPNPPGTGNYETDFRIEEGIAIYDFFVPISTGVPAGIISRTGGPSSYVVNKLNWKATIDPLVAMAPDVSIKSVTQFDIPTRTACVNSEIEFLNPLSGTFRVESYLIEDSIVDWQKNGSPTLLQGDPYYPIGDIPNYVHNHVLRDVFGHIGTNEGEPAGTGNIWGDEIISGNVSSGDKFYVRRSLSGISTVWNQAHLSVVTFVYDATTYEILQVVHTPL